MKLHVWMSLALAVGCMLMGSTLGAGDKKDKAKKDEPKEVVVDGELINADVKDKVLTESYCKTYTYKMTEGRTYQIDLKSRTFDAYLRLENPQGNQVAEDDDSGGMLDARIIYKAPKSGDYTICAMSLGGGSTGKFTLIVQDVTKAAGAVKDAPVGKAIELKNEKGQANFTGNIVANDALYKNKKHKLFLFNMEAGKTYQIDMKSTKLDSYLFLEDPQGNLLAQDDDSGGFPDAQIVHKATVTGKHRIVATYFGGRIGEFTLTIRPTDGVPPPEGKKDTKDK